MSHVAPSVAPASEAPRSGDASLGSLVSDLSSQIPDLIRSEIRLAQAELTAKGKRAGIGLGMFSAAGVLGFLGLATLVATAVLLLDLLMPTWAAALLVAVVLLVIAGIVALLGKKKVAEAGAPKPERAIANVKQDLDSVKTAAKGDRS